MINLSNRLMKWRYCLFLIISTLLFSHCADKYVKDEWHSYEDYSYLDKDSIRIVLDSKLKLSYLDLRQLSDDTKKEIQSWLTESFLLETYQNKLRASLTGLAKQNKINFSISDVQPSSSNVGLHLSFNISVNLDMQYLDFQLWYREWFVLKDLESKKIFLNRQTSTKKSINGMEFKSSLNHALAKIADENAKYFFNQLNLSSKKKK